MSIIIISAYGALVVATTSIYQGFGARPAQVHYGKFHATMCQHMAKSVFLIGQTLEMSTMVFNQSDGVPHKKRRF